MNFSQKKIRIVYYANQNVGVACLEELIKHPEIEIAAVVVLKKDFGETLQYRSVEDFARENRLPVLVCPDDMNADSFVDKIRELKPDYGLSVAWRKIFKQPIMESHLKGIINFHGAYLPHFRGAVPTNWAIIKGARSTGVSVHFIDEGIDTGPIILQEKLSIGEKETAWEVRQRQDRLSVSLMKKLIAMFLKYETLPSCPQNSKKGRTYGVRKPEDGLINFAKPAKEIYNFVRALTKPYPGAFTFVQSHKMLIWKVEVVDEKDKPGVYFKCGDSRYIEVIDAETI